MRAQTDLKHRLHQNVDFFSKSFPTAGSIHRPTLIQFGPLHRTSFTGEDRTEFHLVHHTKKKGAGPAALSEGPEKSFTGRISVFKMTFPNLAGGRCPSLAGK